MEEKHELDLEMGECDISGQSGQSGVSGIGGISDLNATTLNMVK